MCVLSAAPAQQELWRRAFINLEPNKRKETYMKFSLKSIIFISPVALFYKITCKNHWENVQGGFQNASLVLTKKNKKKQLWKRHFLT